MSEQEYNDETLLIDYVLKQLPGPEMQAVRKRIATDPDFARRGEDIRNTFGAMQLIGQAVPPDDLMSKTLARIQSAKQTEALLTQQDLGRRIAWPTFSLREVAAIAASILMMASVFIPAARHSRARTLTNECSANVGQIGSALRTYANDHHFNLPATADHHSRWLPTSTESAASNSANLFRLIQVGYTSPVAFQCPAMGGGSFVVQPGMTDFPDNKFVGYSYQHALGVEGLRLDNSALMEVADSMAILADSTPRVRQRPIPPGTRSRPGQRQSRTGRPERTVPGHARGLAQNRRRRRERKQHLPGRGNFRVQGRRNPHQPHRFVPPARRHQPRHRGTLAVFLIESPAWQRGHPTLVTRRVCHTNPPQFAMVCPAFRRGLYTFRICRTSYSSHLRF